MQIRGLALTEQLRCLSSFVDVTVQILITKILNLQEADMRLLVIPPVRGQGKIHGFVLDGKTLPIRIGYCSNTNCGRRFRSEENNVDLSN